jgi:acyl-CoA dehydrogenase
MTTSLPYSHLGEALATDYFQVRDQFTDEQWEHFLATRRFVDDDVLPAINEYWQAEELPWPLLRRIADLGLYGEDISGYGCPGMSPLARGLVNMELHRGDGSIGTFLGVQSGLAMKSISLLGSEEQKERWLPAMAKLDAVGAFALTEPDHGSDSVALETTARRDGDGWVINGGKRYITNAPLADLFMVFARSNPEEKGGRGISSFVVETSTPGVTVGPKDKKMGQSGAWTAEVFFDDVHVAADALIGEEGRGYAKALTVLSRGRLHIAALCVGMAQRVLDESVAYAATAKQGGAPIGRFQLVQGLLADTHAELLAGRSMVLDVAARYDSGADTSIGPSSAKLFCSEMVGRAVDRAVQVHGGLGYLRTTPVERFYRDARLFRLYEGTSEVQRVIIGGGLLREAGMARG